MSLIQDKGIASANRTQGNRRRCLASHQGTWLQGTRNKHSSEAYGHLSRQDGASSWPDFSSSSHAAPSSHTQSACQPPRKRVLQPLRSRADSTTCARNAAAAVMAFRLITARVHTWVAVDTARSDKPCGLSRSRPQFQCASDAGPGGSAQRASLMTSSPRAFRWSVPWLPLSYNATTSLLAQSLHGKVNPDVNRHPAGRCSM